MKNKIIILAGGKGTRMNSTTPKPLIELDKIPFIYRVIRAGEKLDNHPAIIIGKNGEEIKKKLGDRYTYVIQDEPLGTGHAIKCAKDQLDVEGVENIIVLPSDHPFISSDTLEKLVDSHEKNYAKITISTINVPDYDSKEYAFYWESGRVIRNSEGKINSILEFKDADENQKKIKEVNVSYYCFDIKWLWQEIESLTNNNAQKEYYLTDLVAIASSNNLEVNSLPINDPLEGLGINNQEDFEQAKQQSGLN